MCDVQIEKSVPRVTGLNHKSQNSDLDGQNFLSGLFTHDLFCFLHANFIFRSSINFMQNDIDVG